MKRVSLSVIFLLFSFNLNFCLSRHKAEPVFEYDPLLVTPQALASSLEVGMKDSSSSSHPPSSSSSSSQSPGRKSKLFPYFLIQFPNEHCSGTAGSGVCVSAKDCRMAKGTFLGACAQGFGACCRYNRSCGKEGGDIVIKENSTEIRSMNGSSSCRFVLPKGRNICQVRLDFPEFEFGYGLPSGECSDTKVIIGGGGNQMNLCGNLTGQHLVLNYGSADKLYISSAEPAADSDKYAIRLSYLRCNSKQSVPSHCTQQYTGSQGQIRSLNWPQQQLNNQEYTVCIIPPEDSSTGRGSRSRNDGRFRPSSTNQQKRIIEWSTCGNGPDDFLISGNRSSGPVLDPSTCDTDYIQIFGGNKQCGNTFRNEIISSPPYLLRVRFDGAETVGKGLDQVMLVSKPGEGCESLNTRETKCIEAGGPEISNGVKSDSGDGGKKGVFVCKCVRNPANLRRNSRADEANTGFCLAYKFTEV